MAGVAAYAPADACLTFIPVGNLYNDAVHCRGTAFTLASATTIVGLGWLDAEGNGLAVAHSVGLWNSSGTLLVQALVNNASKKVVSGEGTATWFISEIVDLTLAPGTYRVGGTMNSDSSGMVGDRIGNGVTLGAGYVRMNSLSGGFAYPNGTYGTAVLHATISTHMFDVNQVPEPMSISLLGLGLLALGAARKRG